MRGVYWRSRRHSIRVMLLLALVSVAALLAVERFQIRELQPHHAAKLRASERTLHGFQVLKEERLRRGEAIDSSVDPMGSGLIGRLLSPITTGPGIAAAKQTSINPNFAAVVVHLLKRAGVREGDTVAVALSGSFPALNVATLAAVESLGARPVTISSVGASALGANIPTFAWPDMERVLVERKVLAHRSVAVSPGGIEDRVLGLSKEGRQAVDEAMTRSELPRIDPSDMADSIAKRMTTYSDAAGSSAIRAFVNVGGGTSTVGTRLGKELFKPGLNRTLPRGAPPDSVMVRFVTQGVPVIHLTRIELLAHEFGLPSRPTAMPRIGEGIVFARLAQSRGLAVGSGFIIFGLLYALLRRDLGSRLVARLSPDDADDPPEEMV